MKFTKKNPAGKVIPQTYYTDDYKYEIEKGTTGWNVNELGRDGMYAYSFGCETLREAKAAILAEY